MSQYDENRDGSRDGKRENRSTVSEVDNAAVALTAVPEIAEVSTGVAGPGSIGGRGHPYPMSQQARSGGS